MKKLTIDKRDLDSLIAPQQPANPAIKEVVPTVTNTIPPFKIIFS